MNARLILALALVFCAAVARGEEESSLAGVETVEPTFLEEAADAEGSPFQLSKKMKRSTVEPRYYGENNAKPKEYVTPEYQDPKPVDPKLKKNQPVLFTSHYFSPLPKNLKGLKASKDKKGRKLVPFRATVQTPAGLKISQNGFTEAELFDGRLPNKFDDPRDKMKRTLAPAVLASFVEVDTTEAADAQAHAVPPPFSQADLAEGEHAATTVSADQFFADGFVAPTWKDEEANESESSESTGEVESDESAASVEDSVEQYEDLESFLEQAQANTAAFVQIDETAETEDEEESEVETEDEEESEDAEEESEESESEEEEPVALVETDSEDLELDEMEVNERAAAQIDMDAVSDEAAMTESDADEQSSAEEADAETEEEVDEDEALEEAENADAASLVEQEATESEGVDTLLAEVDSHLSSDSETEVEAQTSKGTPGSTIAPGQTWEDAQNERLSALQSKLEAEKAAAPKVQAQVVASKAELNAVDEEHQNPEYNSDAATEQVETVEPEILVEKSSAQQVLLEKIAKLKAIRRA